MSSTKNPSPASSKSTPTKPSTAVRAGKYTFVGIILTVFNFGLYTIIARLMGNNDFLWLDTFISTAATTILAYILHSKITWKERSPGKSGIYKFFIWNALCAVIIGPFFTWLFTLITPLYDFIYSISTAIHLPFDYNFVQSTSVFILTSIVAMILNYLFYDRFVFSESKSQSTPSKPSKS
ncbi:GtrA family protein [Candidatus Saccharibacteria bacterium]|nr:GtrA family protein [Candidatus Saccharibacteria bacterium]